MAESKDIKQARTNLTNAFSEIDSSSKLELFTRVSELNKERDEYINAEVEKYVTENYLIKHFREYDPYIAGGETKESFIRSKLSIEQKMDIIGEYTNEHQIFEGNEEPKVKLTDIAERKRENKLRYKQEALEIIEMYENAINENKTKIQILESDIVKTKEQIASAEAKLQEIMGKEDESLAFAGRTSAKFDKDKAIAETKKLISDLNKKLQKQEGLLVEFKSLQAKFEIEFRKRKTEIEENLQQKNIFLYERKGEKATAETEKEDASEKDKQDEKAKNSKGNSTDKPVPTTDRAIAKAMMQDFFNASPERQRKLLDRMDNQGILDMTEKLGPINRARLNVILSQRLEELPLGAVTFNGISIGKAELKNIRKMDSSKLIAIREEMDKFNSEFTQKTIDEIEEFEDKLKYARIGALLSETGMFRGIGRILDISRIKSNNILELSKSLAEYARIKKARVLEKEAWKDSLRAAIGRPKMNPLAKDGQNMLNRDPKDNSRF